VSSLRGQDNFTFVSMYCGDFVETEDENEVLLLRGVKRLMLFPSSPSWALDIYAPGNAVDRLARPFCVFVLP
jgi:hypothetical protein